MFLVKSSKRKDKQFFQGKELFFKNFDFKKRYENDIEFCYEKICSRLSNTVSHKIDFTAYGLHRDYPPTRELIFGQNIILTRKVALKFLFDANIALIYEFHFRVKNLMFIRKSENFQE